MVKAAGCWRVFSSCPDQKARAVSDALSKVSAQADKLQAARECSRAALFCAVDMTPSLDSLLPAALNHLLAQESWARARLLPHAGKVALCEIGPATVRLQIDGDGLVSVPDAAALPAVTIRIRAADLPLIARDRSRAVSYVRIEGDADLANALSQVAQSLRWDVEDDLGRIIGDIAARRLVGAANATLDTVRTTQRKFLENCAEYFLEENPMLVRPHAVTDFTADVIRLRDDVERLAKRIERLS
jgi:ubiquinone biosynthesis protein UbiJ